MANNTAWVGGNINSGLSWATLINSGDLTSLGTASNAAISNAISIANGTGLDQFMDISIQLAIASSTIAAGANIAIWLAMLQQDGSTYGDGILVAGTPAAYTPPWPPVAVFPLWAAATRTTLIGQVNGIVIPPGSFKAILQNNSGFALTSGTQSVSFRTYNQQLNH